VSERQIAITTDSWRVFAARRRHRHQLADAAIGAKPSRRQKT
jgi:hypothetical protein